MIGSTGVAPTSGDIDLAIDASLTRDYISGFFPTLEKRHHGNALHVCCPISGNSELGYVQVDFMFGDRDFLKWAMRQDPKETQITRQVLLHAICKPLGYLWVPTHGLKVNDQYVTDKYLIVKLLFGDNVTPEMVDTVEQINNLVTTHVQ